MGLAYRFIGSVHYHHGRKHGSVQGGIALKAPTAARRALWITVARLKNTSKTSKACLHSDILPLKGYTLSKKTTHTNRTIFHGPNLFKLPHRKILYENSLTSSPKSTSKEK